MFVLVITAATLERWCMLLSWLTPLVASARRIVWIVCTSSYRKYCTRFPPRRLEGVIQVCERPTSRCAEQCRRIVDTSNSKYNGGRIMSTAIAERGDNHENSCDARTERTSR